MTEPREPYTAPADPALLTTVDVAQNQIVTFGGTDGGVYSSLPT
jgi:hypothetical protein